MSNTTKSLAFILSIFAFFIYFTFSVPLIAFANNKVPASFYAYLFNINIFAGFFIILFSQALVKLIYINRKLKGATVSHVLPVSPFRFIDRLLIYVLPAIALLFPIISKRAFNYNSMVTVLFLLIFIVVTETIFFLSQKTMKVYVTDKGLAIKGLDLRLELPFPSAYPTNSGFYSYDRLDTFLALNDSIQLQHCYDLGVISIPCSGETLKQIKGLLLFHKVPEKRF